MNLVPTDHSRGKTADSVIHSGSVGIDRMTSMMRWMRVSTQPPR